MRPTYGVSLLMDREGKVHKFINRIDAVEAIASKNYFELREDELERINAGKMSSSSYDLIRTHEDRTLETEERNLENVSQGELTIIRSKSATGDNEEDSLEDVSEDNI